MSDSKTETAGFFNSTRGTFSGLAEKSSASINKLRDKRFCIGITGLSQSGKSTFITSLINQLQQHKTANLPGFEPILSERLLNVKIHPLHDKDLPPFPYEEAYKGMTGPNPVWPKSTQDISGCL